MKRTLLVLLALLPATAFASKARMSALGQAESGSYFFADQRNIFHNPAYLADYNNWVATEWGTDTMSLADTTEDSNANTRAEGGFAYSMDNLVLGGYFGRGQTRIVDADVHNATTVAFLSQNNLVELSLAGKGEMDFGATLVFSTQRRDFTASVGGNTEVYKYDGSNIALRGGVKNDMFGAYAELGLSNAAKGSYAAGNTIVDKDDEYKNIVSFKGGANVKVSDFTVYGDVQRDGYDFVDKSLNKTGEYRTWLITAGMGAVKQVKEPFRLISNVFVTWSDIKQKKVDAADTKKDENVTALNGLFGFEVLPASWLTLRASVASPLYRTDDTKNDTVKTKTVNDGSTIVAAGAGMKFIEGLEIDGTFSMNTSGAYAAGDNTLSQVSLNYFY